MPVIELAIIYILTCFRANIFFFDLGTAFDGVSTSRLLWLWLFFLMGVGQGKALAG